MCWASMAYIFELTLAERFFCGNRCVKRKLSLFLCLLDFGLQKCCIFRNCIMGVLSTCCYQSWSWLLRVQMRSKSVHSKHGKFWLTTLPQTMVRESLDNFKETWSTYQFWWFLSGDVFIFYKLKRWRSLIILFSVHVYDLYFASVENTFYMSLNRFIDYAPKYL